MLIHCGDAEIDLKALIPDPSLPVYAVKGNCDVLSPLPEVLTVKVGYYNLMITHGHRYHIRSSMDLLLEAARQNFADVVLFGHTHVPVNYRAQESGILVVNPGSLCRGKQHMQCLRLVRTNCLRQKSKCCKTSACGWDIHKH